MSAAVSDVSSWYILPSGTVIDSTSLRTFYIVILRSAAPVRLHRLLHLRRETPTPPGRPPNAPRRVSIAATGGPTLRLRSRTPVIVVVRSFVRPSVRPFRPYTPSAFLPARRTPTRVRTIPSAVKNIRRPVLYSYGTRGVYGQF